MFESTTILPALPVFRPQGIPVAPMSMQKILTKAIRSHGTGGNLKNFKVKGADKMGGKTAKPAKSGRTARTAPGARTATAAPRK